MNGITNFTACAERALSHCSRCARLLIEHDCGCMQLAGSYNRPPFRPGQLAWQVTAAHLDGLGQQATIDELERLVLRCCVNLDHGLALHRRNLRHHRALVLLERRRRGYAILAAAVLHGRREGAAYGQGAAGGRLHEG